MEGGTMSGDISHDDFSLLSKEFIGDDIEMFEFCDAGDDVIEEGIFF